MFVSKKKQQKNTAVNLQNIVKIQSVMNESSQNPQFKILSNQSGSATYFIGFCNIPSFTRPDLQKTVQ